MALADDLADALGWRKLDDVRALLPEARRALKEILPSRGDSYRLLDYAARSIDLDWSLLGDVEEALGAFTAGPLGCLWMSDLAHLDIATGLVAFHRGDYPAALARLGDALRAADRIQDDDLKIVTRYNIARCYWREGTYSKALTFAQEAEALAEGWTSAAIVPVIKILKHWLYFLTGDYVSSLRLLDEVRQQLSPNDHVSRGDVLSATGRRLRQERRYDEALDHFAQAIAAYSQFDRHYRNIGRCHHNIAFVYRLKALEIEQKPGLSSEARKRMAAKDRTEAFGHLRKAVEIYQLHPERQRHGLGTVENIRALLFCDLGKYSDAIRHAETAFRLGRNERNEDASDYAVMANSKIVQCKAELDRGRFSSRRTAKAAADEAVELALKTQNRRLIARAYTWLGFALLKPPFNAPDEAEYCWREARNRLRPEDLDYLVDDVDELRRQIDKFDGSEPVVDVLTKGAVLDRDLEETLLEVEVKIIRYAYEECDRIARRTAKELGIGHGRVERARQLWERSAPGPLGLRHSVAVFRKEQLKAASSTVAMTTTGLPQALASGDATEVRDDVTRPSGRPGRR